jgi:RNA methyltransferase, TrmH family
MPSHRKLAHSLRSLSLLLQHVRSLAHRSVRDQTETFFIEGIRPFVQAHDAGHAFEHILISPILLKSDLADMLARRHRVNRVPTTRLTPEQYRSISTSPHASGIAAIVRQRWSRLAQVDPSRGLAWLVIEHLRSPGNLGTILRTAEATGVGGIILLSQTLDPFDPSVVRASMGGMLHLPLVRATHQELARWASANDVALVGLSPDASLLWTDLPPLPRIALLVGTERKGLSHEARALAPLGVRLPMTGKADSLNVAAATAVMLYELVRRRSGPFATATSQP